MSNLKYYENKGYDKEQMIQIRKGLENDIDVSVYADTKFNEYEMEEIRLGLKAGLNVSIYADPKYNFEEMQEMMEELLEEKEDEYSR